MWQLRWDARFFYWQRVTPEDCGDGSANSLNNDQDANPYN
jgi:hypothetical protein